MAEEAEAAMEPFTVNLVNELAADHESKMATMLETVNGQLKDQNKLLQDAILASSRAAMSSAA